MTLPQVPPDGKTFDEMIGNLNSIGGEPRSAVLITHLYTEYLLDWILRKKISKPDKILERSFYSKLELIESFNLLSHDLMNDLWLVNEVRNHFAHRIDMDSQDFQNKFLDKVRRMRYYIDSAKRFKGYDTYHIYNMIMFRVYAVIKSEYDKL